MSHPTDHNTAGTKPNGGPHVPDGAQAAASQQQDAGSPRASVRLPLEEVGRRYQLGYTTTIAARAGRREILRSVEAPHLGDGVELRLVRDVAGISVERSDQPTPLAGPSHDGLLWHDPVLSLRGELVAIRLVHRDSTLAERAAEVERSAREAAAAFGPAAAEAGASSGWGLALVEELEQPPWLELLRRAAAAADDETRALPFDDAAALGAAWQARVALEELAEAARDLRLAGALQALDVMWEDAGADLALAHLDPAAFDDECVPSDVETWWARAAHGAWSTAPSAVALSTAMRAAQLRRAAADDAPKYAVPVGVWRDVVGEAAAAARRAPRVPGRGATAVEWRVAAMAAAAAGPRAPMHLEWWEPGGDTVAHATGFVAPGDGRDSSVVLIGEETAVTVKLYGSAQVVSVGIGGVHAQVQAGPDEQRHARIAGSEILKWGDDGFGLSALQVEYADGRRALWWPLEDGR